MACDWHQVEPRKLVLVVHINIQVATIAPATRSGQVERFATRSLCLLTDIISRRVSQDQAEGSQMRLGRQKNLLPDTVYC